ncbi:adenine-specific DNA-methyltransferase [Marmoricola sp. URHA0025 HA25]
MTRLELTWPGKDQFLLVPRDQEGKPVWVDRDHPAAAEVRVSDFVDAVGEVDDAEPHADNLLMIGDSLDALRILSEVPEYRRAYRGKIRLVYIDPPFNTGQAFAHYDDWLEHATWLSFMHERLGLIRELLAPNGSLWVHLDDAEHHHMRVLLDDVFGRAAFVDTVVWQKADSPRNSARWFSNDQDYISVYAKDPSVWRPNRLARTDESNAIYANPDGDARGPWLAGDPFANKPYSKGQYEYTGPTGRVFSPPAGKYWRLSEDRLRELDDDGRVWWGPKGDARPSIKRYLSEVSDLVPRTIWLSSDVGSNRTSNREMKQLFPGLPAFSTPKPERLLERVIHIGSDPGDIVLDCFAGSGTTAAAAHKMGRRWVTSEVLPETVETFTRTRLELVVKGADPGGITEAVSWPGGAGFRVVEIGPSMYVDTPFGVLLSDAATNGSFSKAVAGQLGYLFQPEAAPLSGVRGRMRLAVLDGVVGTDEVRAVVGALNEGERVEIVGRAILDGSAALLGELSKGSKITKAPRDLLSKAAQRTRRRAAREAVQ